jgi:hypothetical protein
MDAASIQALSLAVDLAVPDVVAQVMLENERLRMEKEDIAAAGMVGRLYFNLHMQPTGLRPISWDRVRDIWMSEIRQLRRESPPIAGWARLVDRLRILNFYPAARRAAIERVTDALRDLLSEPPDSSDEDASEGSDAMSEG